MFAGRIEPANELFADTTSEDIRNTILVLYNYDGENLGEFRRNLMTYGAVKIRRDDGQNGGVEALHVEVNPENFQLIQNLLKRAIIENGRGFDAKDEPIHERECEPDEHPGGLFRY